MGSQGLGGGRSGLVPGRTRILAASIRCKVFALQIFPEEFCHDRSTADGR